MKKLLLISNGLGALIDFVEANPKSLKLVFIPTAGNTSDNPWWIERDRKVLQNIGFQFSELDIEGKNAGQVRDALKVVDIIFVAGGNTFFLLDMMQRCGFKNILLDIFHNGAKYVGGSAGAVVCGPDIEPVKSLDDPSDAPNLKTTKALGLVSFVVIPHVNDREDRTSFDEIKRDFSDRFEVISINDRQAIVVDSSGNYEIIKSE